MMPRKKIDLLAPPFKGHLHPILAIGKILQQEYEIRVLSSAAAKTDIHAAGLTPVIFESIDDQALFASVNPDQSIGSSPIKLAQQFKQVFRFFQQLHHELDTIYQSNTPDLLIADFTLAVIGPIAEKYHIPWWTSMPSPCVIECDGGAPAYLGGWKTGNNTFYSVRNWLGRKLTRMFKQLIFLSFKRAINKLGITRLHREDGSEQIYSPDTILCLGNKHLEFDRPWPKAAKFVGPMLYSPKLNTPPPKFEAGKKYILVTLGTHLNWRKASLYKEVEQLAEHFPNYVFHFSCGNAHKKQIHTSHKRCINYSYINYEEHIHHYQYAIHHGGAGIMYYCLQHGIPSLVIPQDYDQFDHAARLEAKNLAIWVKKSNQLEKELNRLIHSSSIHTQVIRFKDQRSTNENQLMALVDQYFE
ncbi:glycosyltransferase [Teredinibacter sp. KSP-S5-2]|uniref:glycosyltransferase n=1 Tax=Teredinibacter sp. KSP-S5-2 TaxID=3034506 RepID=UPI002934A2EC|nr:glycosyltransferase [Teredinibacter sp. KSP-S5-2]WNO08306.1 glycosyltransferase [Teredinibacter sp. KSP-S5-2]